MKSKIIKSNFFPTLPRHAVAFSEGWSREMEGVAPPLVKGERGDFGEGLC